MCGKSLVCGLVRAESPTSSQPRATPWVPCPHSLRPVRAKVKINRSPILLPLQGEGLYILVPRALPWAENWLPFQGARGEGCGAAAPVRGSYSRIGACPYLSPQLIDSRCCPCKGRISLAGLAPQYLSRYEPLTGALASLYQS